MSQTKKKRGLKPRKSRKNTIRGGMSDGKTHSVRDTKYSTTMIKNTGTLIKPPKPNSYSSVCTEISNQTGKLGSITKG
jgi:hypothetical protein